MRCWKHMIQGAGAMLAIGLAIMVFGGAAFLTAKAILFVTGNEPVAFVSGGIAALVLLGAGIGLTECLSERKRT